MQPQEGMPMQAGGQQVMGGGQQVIVIQNKSGGPKVFGIIAIILGVLGVGQGIMGIGAWDGVLWMVLGVLGIISSGVFGYAGVLLFQYQRSGVWWGFGAIGINVLSGLILTLTVAKEAGDALGDDAGGFFASLGLALVGIQAVCCSLIVALPLLMNGADLD